MSEKAGKFVSQPQGYKAFIPEQMTHKPSIKFDEELLNLLSQADRAIARLDGIVTVLPNPEIFIAMYVKKEAVLSSQIEGTQASLEGVLEFEANLLPKDNIEDIKEVVNYVNAMNYGIERIKTLPMSLRLIKEIHKILLLEKTRGSTKNPGEFRTVQNWIGPSGASLSEAIFVPPPPNMVVDLMSDLEKFIHQKDNIPPLIKISLIHYQFETIHPFLDGNGRVGRLLLALTTYVWCELSMPWLYVSAFFEKYKNEYIFPHI